MPDSLEQLRIDADDVRERGMAPDRIVLRAIGLGCDTRKAIKEATGFDYASIEKALERENATICKSTKGMIERLTLASGNGNSAKSALFNPAFSEKKPSTNASPARGRQDKPIDVVALEEAMATEETVEKAAKKIGISTPTLYLRRQRDPAIAEAVERGRKRYYQNAAEIDVNAGEPEDEPVAYIEETETSPVAPIKTEIAESINGSLQHRLAKILFIEDPNSPVLREALELAEKEITVKVLANQPPPAMLDLNRLPSALIKEIRDDDAFFANAYDTLIGILSDDMDGDEKAAIWTLILYLKSLDAQRWEFRKP